jgi:tetratricopeptide (TPR) repeat protein
MDDLNCRHYLAVLLFQSDRDAILQDYRGLEEVKTKATQLFRENKILERHDPLACFMQLEYAEILYNHGSLDEAARIRQRVLDETRQCAEPDKPWRLVRALRSYAESLMVSGDTAGSRALLNEALVICKTSLEPENMHALECQKALAKLHKIDGRTAEAIEVSYDILKIQETSSGNTYPETTGAMSDLAVYLALASRWEESMEMICRAEGHAKENLSDNDVMKIPVALNSSFLIGAMCLPAAERDGRGVVVTERGGRVFATLRGERIVEEPQSTLADRSHGRDHKSLRRSLWNFMSVPARYLCRRIPHMRSGPRD